MNSQPITINETTRQLLGLISEHPDDLPKGAFNIRQDSSCAGKQSTDHIEIVTKTEEGKSGINIIIKKTAQKETVYIPAFITKSLVEDLVYNDFYIEDGADVTIVAGCGIHTDSEDASSHNGIHRFFVGKNAKVLYLEKHIGIGEGSGNRSIDPVTYAEIAEGGYLEMDTSQLSGVDRSTRKTECKLEKGARLVIKENLLTELDQTASTDFLVELNGEGCGVDLVSRSVAKDTSHQSYRSVIHGNNVCSGHSACDAIIVGDATVTASPDLTANHPDAMLIHEAAIGKIAGDQIVKLQTLGLTEEEAEQTIINGFLK